MSSLNIPQVSLNASRANLGLCLICKESEATRLYYERPICEDCYNLVIGKKIPLCDICYSSQAWFDWTYYKVCAFCFLLAKLKSRKRARPHTFYPKRPVVTHNFYFGGTNP